MAVDLTKAKLHLNIDAADTSDDTELTFFVQAANEWIATQVDDVTPTPVQLATLELIRHWWDSQRGPATQVDDEGFSLGLLGFAIPTRVKELLGPYLSGSGSAPAAPAGSFPDALPWPDAVCW